MKEVAESQLEIVDNELETMIATLGEFLTDSDKPSTIIRELTNNEKQNCTSL